MTRVTRNAHGQLRAGRTLPGRGAWICTSELACWETAIRRGALGKALRGSVDPDEVQRVWHSVAAGSRDVRD
jgi:predicted RNA-binding protein YlxR (DUF448 family)